MPPNPPTINTYTALRDEVTKVLSAGKERARQAVEREKARTYWEVGVLIQAHLLANDTRAGYGKYMVPRLAQAVGISERILYESLQFYRSFPILRARAELTWSHYRTLMKVPSDNKRYLFAKEADRHGWTSRELAAQIQAGTLPAKSVQQPEKGQVARLQAKRGRLFTYRLIEAPSERGLRLDLGFGILLKRSLNRLGNPEEGTFVEAVRRPGGEEPLFKLRTIRDRRAFYSYRAYVERVIDGDTIWMDVDCGFQVWSRQKVRLRGIDTPELSTKAGQEARAFVASALSGNTSVAATTTKPDKYDRYLADLFYLPGKGKAENAQRNGRFLNGELLRKGYAKSH